MSQNTNSTKTQPATICRSFGCNTNLTAIDPASQYQRLKLIQNTVRVQASLYTHDLGALTVYQRPIRAFANVNWNQMSDRAVRHVQPSIVTGGSFYHGSSTKHTITRCRPGAGCPGGSGVDIKHNSYDRYLNRLKGKGPVRRGVVPPGFGKQLPFNGPDTKAITSFHVVGSDRFIEDEPCRISDGNSSYDHKVAFNTPVVSVCTHEFTFCNLP